MAKIVLRYWSQGGDTGLTEKKEEPPRSSRHLSLRPDETGIQIIKDYMSKKGLW